MISKLAMEDIKALKDSGASLNPEDIVSLNALGLACERSADSRHSMEIRHPRIARLPDGTPLYEPTVQSDIWIAEQVYPYCGERSSFLYALAFALAHAREAHFFERLDNPAGIDKAVKRWMRSVCATRDQLAIATSYAMFGADPDEPANDDGEEPEKNDGRTKIDKRLDELYCELSICGVLPEGYETRNKTYAEISAALNFFAKLEGSAPSEKDVMASEHAVAVAKYGVLLEKLRKGGKDGK